MTPEVERQLWRSVSSLISVASYLCHAVFYAFGALGSFFEQRSQIFDAKADVLDESMVDELEED